jgi:hypothetical protein
MQLEPWYDGLHFWQDAEEVFGLTLIAFQNYINSSIYERKAGGKPLDSTIDFYEIGQKINNSSITNIQLIVTLSNYYKHRDDLRPLQKHTTKVLDKLDLAYNIETSDGHKFDPPDDSPITLGVEMLSKDYNLLEILSKVTSWREEIWKI